MTRLAQVFDELRAAGRKAVIPFVTAGDPDLESTAKLLEALAGIGCPILELGIPYSDPIADGPVIQASYTRALDRGVRLNQIWPMVREVTRRISSPIVIMCSMAIVHRVGVSRFFQQAIDAGACGAIIPDLLLEELPAVAEEAEKYRFPLVQLVTPTTPRPRAVQIAKASRGFLYYVSVTGITGERQQLPVELVQNVAWLRSQTDLPIAIGFGISSPEHVRMLAPVADGLIVGSAIVRRLERCSAGQIDQVLPEVLGFVRSLIDAADSKSGSGAGPSDTAGAADRACSISKNTPQ
ncbi:MAG: tryptophan synthase alpha chain [Pirellulaceae bacterium]|nr:MAG: tryptophan synthase alpha chain [Pirellulaceae bacterium]